MCAVCLYLCVYMVSVCMFCSVRSLLCVCVQGGLPVYVLYLCVLCLPVCLWSTYTSVVCSLCVPPVCVSVYLDVQGTHTFITSA